MSAASQSHLNAQGLCYVVGQQANDPDFSPAIRTIPSNEGRQAETLRPRTPPFVRSIWQCGCSAGAAMRISRRRKAIRDGAAPSIMSRRDVLGAAGVGGLMLWTDGAKSLVAAVHAEDQARSHNTVDNACLLVPNLTQGPFFVDEHLNRSDIRSSSKGTAKGEPCPGLPLTLHVSVFAYGKAGCTPLPGTQVDVWHCDGLGLYSDVRNFGDADTRGRDFLRGYQVTDSGGQVTFKTIYPGWYMGRAVHVHLKARFFDASKNTTTEATTQVFFDDATTDAVFRANSPYSARGPRAMRNADDAIYGERAPLLLPLQGVSSSGYAARFSLGIQVGSLRRDEPHGPGPWRR